MSRSAFGRWGAGLDRVEFVQALAAAGVGDGSFAGDELAALLEKSSRVRWDLPELPPQGTIEPSDLGSFWQAALADARRPLRIAIGAWPSSKLRLPWLVEQLADSAVGADAVFLEGGDAAFVRWSWPLQVAILDDGRSELRDALTTNPPWWVERFVDLVEPEAPEPCDLLLVPSGLRAAVARILPAPIKASVVVLLERLGEPWSRAHTLVDTLLMDLEAGAVAFAPIGENPAAWLEGVFETLAHDDGLDVALLTAARRLELPPPVVLAPARVLEETRIRRIRDHMGERFRGAVAMANGGGPALEAAAEAVESTDAFDHESSGATALADRAREARELLPRPEPRFLQAQVFDEATRKPVRALQPRALHEVLVFLGPPQEDALVAGEAAFPEHELPAGREHRLTVVLTEPRLLDEPQVAEIVLPVQGPSTTCSFMLPGGEGEGRVEARVSVLHEGRILQTAVLRGEVTTEAVDDERALRFTVDGFVHPASDLEARTRFDAALLLNHDRGDAPWLTLMASEHYDLVQPLGFEAATEAISAKLETFVVAEAAFSLQDERTRELLVFLGKHGWLLFKALSELNGGAALASAERVQIVAARADAYFPLEFVYDRPAPNEDAQLCPNATRALETGRCENCPSLTDRAFVCPLGLWCLSKVIERHAYDVEVAPQVGGDFTVGSAPVETRRRLPALSAAIFAASSKADEAVTDTTAKLAATLEQAIGIAPVRARTWKEWQDQIAAGPLPLLVALPHTVKNQKWLLSALQIEKDQDLGVEAIDSTYVGAAPPIVILLGCDTGDTTIPFQRFPAAFRQSGAAVVVATLTKVLGRNAGPVAARLAEALARRAGAGRTTFGEVMREVRRSLLAEGVPTILAVTAYGDADWILGPEGG